MRNVAKPKPCMVHAAASKGTRKRKCSLCMHPVCVCWPQKVESRLYACLSSPSLEQRLDSLTSLLLLLLHGVDSESPRLEPLVLATGDEWLSSSGDCICMYRTLGWSSASVCLPFGECVVIDGCTLFMSTIRLEPYSLSRIILNARASPIDTFRNSQRF